MILLIYNTKESLKTKPNNLQISSSESLSVLLYTKKAKYISNCHL